MPHPLALICKDTGNLTLHLIITTTPVRGCFFTSNAMIEVSRKRPRINDSPKEASMAVFGHNKRQEIDLNCSDLEHSTEIEIVQNNSFLFQMPKEILDLILDYLNPPDVINLGSTCLELRQLLMDHIFSVIYSNWQQIKELNEGFRLNISPFYNQLKEYTRKLVILNADASGQWYHVHELSQILKACSNISHIDLPCTGSAYWIKYIEGPIYSLKSLTCTSIRNKKKWLEPFEISHLKVFPNLTTLNLQGFEITCTIPVNESSTITPTGVQVMRLTNCSWLYPQNVTDFGPVVSLELLYIDEYEILTLSERFTELMKSHPPLLNELAVRVYKTVEGKEVISSLTAWKRT